MSIKNIRDYHIAIFHKFGISTNNKPYERCVEELMQLTNDLYREKNATEKDKFWWELNNIHTYRQN